MVHHKVEASHQDHKEDGGGADPTRQIIGLAMKIHRQIGPGLLESVYEECLCFELKRNGFAFQRQVRLPLIYEDIRLPAVYRADIVIERNVVLEIKSVETILPVHKSQILTYLRLSGCHIGLIMNFNRALLKDGLERFVI